MESIEVGRAADDEVKAGCMAIDEATHAVHHSYPCLFGMHDHKPD
jgi:hypothetical protein